MNLRELSQYLLRVKDGNTSINTRRLHKLRYIQK